MTTSERPEHMRPALIRAEAEVAHHLDEACEDHDRRSIEEQSTDELLRLEEELLAAARAVDEAVRLRRKLGEGREAAPEQPEVTEPARGPAEPPGTRVREFRTASGSEWRVWEVRPGAVSRPRKLELYPADYAEGWLAFELVHGEGRKRLPKFAPEWSSAPEADLEALLTKAVDVPKRRKQDPPAEAGGTPSAP